MCVCVCVGGGGGGGGNNVIYFLSPAATVCDTSHIMFSTYHPLYRALAAGCTILCTSSVPSHPRPNINKFLISLCWFPWQPPQHPRVLFFSMYVTELTILTVNSTIHSATRIGSGSIFKADVYLSLYIYILHSEWMFSTGVAYFKDTMGHVQEDLTFEVLVLHNLQHIVILPIYMFTTYLPTKQLEHWQPASSWERTT